MSPRKRRALKRELRTKFEMPIRQSMSRLWFGMRRAHGTRVSMQQVCTLYELLFQMTAMHISVREPEEIREIKLEVFAEIMADCKRDASRCDSV